MKRLIDITLVLFALVLLLPILICVSVTVAIALGRPIFFVQVRPGLNAVPFRMYKFRTMLNSIDELGHLIDDAQRLTPFGRFLRSTSLDELPEIWNVLMGDMSLVGPRPLLMEYLQLYSAEQSRRHDVRPGITGWAQINGRNAVDWETRLRLDTWYVDNRSVWLDLKILFITVHKVLVRDGINQTGQVTVSKFNGSRNS